MMSDSQLPPLQTYKNVHLWLILPFVIVLFGFAPSYWLQFTDAPWRHHLHGLTATAWFVLLIAQPYLITRRRTRQHRLFGMVALVLAGGTAFSALNVIPYNFSNELMPEVARYGLSFVDAVLVPGFLLAVLMAVINVKNPDDHARWMISTAFWALGPGLFRLLFIPLVIADVPITEDSIPLLLAGAGMSIAVVTAILMFRDRRLHPAWVLAALGGASFFLPMWAGNMQWWRTIADALFKI